MKWKKGQKGEELTPHSNCLQPVRCFSLSFGFAILWLGLCNLLGPFASSELERN